MNPFIDAWLTPWLWLLSDWSLRWSVRIAAVMAWFALRSPRTALLRMLILRMALVGGLLLPVAPAYWGPVAPLHYFQASPPPERSSDAPRPKTTRSAEDALARKGPSPEAGPQAADLGVARQAPATPDTEFPRFSAREPLGWARWTAFALGALWALGALAGAARLAIGCCLLNRLKRGAGDVDEVCLSEFESCRKQLGVTRRVRLVAHAEVNSPMLVGGFRPQILPQIIVPIDWNQRTSASRRAVLLHELAHAQRKDDYAKLFEELVRVAFFFHPLVHWLLARIDADREEICDATAVNHGIAPRELAQVLLEYCRTGAAGRLVTAPGSAALPFFRRRSVKARIQVLMEDHTMSRWTCRPSRLSVGAAMTATLGLLALVGGFGVRAEEPPPDAAAPATAKKPQAEVPTLKIDFPLTAENAADLQAGRPIEVKGLGKVTLHEILPRFNPFMTARLVDVQGNAIVAERGAPAAARVMALCRDGECFPDETGTLADAKGEFFPTLSPHDYESGRPIPLLVQTAAGQWFETSYVLPVEMVEKATIENVRHTTIEVHVPTHMKPKVAPPNDIGADELGGVVVDEQGEPLEGVEVDVYERLAGLNAVTDKQGRFRIRGCDPNEGPLLVRFRKPGYSPLRFFYQAPGVNGWVVALDAKTFFAGTVRGPDGKPVAGASIRANQGPKQNDQGIIGDLWTETATDAASHYRLYVQPDEYEFFVKAPGVGVARLPKQPILHGENRPLDIELQPGATFESTIVDSLTNRPVPGVRLWHWQHPGVEGRSGADGKVTISEMLPGRFEFDVEAEGFARWWSEDAKSPWLRTSRRNPKLNWRRDYDRLDFEIGPDAKAVTIVVERAVRLRGRVVDPDGQPVGGATIAPALTGTGNSLTGDTRFSVESQADGRFELLLPASHQAKYNLVAHDGKYQQWRKWANGVSAPFSTTPGQEINDVELKLTRPATVRGKVVNAAGRPVSNVSVGATVTDQLDNRYYVPPAAKSDEGGQFVLRFLRPGDYHVYADSPSETNIRSATQLTLREGQEVNDVKITLSQLPAGVRRILQYSRTREESPAPSGKSR